jgi:ABC-type antimicrobial peptide transport system permease subunit
VSPRDPATFAGLALLLGAVAIVSIAPPGLRATRVNPIEALREE